MAREFTLKATMVIAGMLAPSLKSATHKASDEIDRLKQRQAQLKKFRTAAGYEKDSDEYKSITEQIQKFGKHIRLTQVEQNKLSAATAKNRRQMLKWGAVLAAGTGILLGTYAAVLKVTGGIEDITNRVIGLRSEFEGFQRVMYRTGVALGNLELGKKVAGDLAQGQLALRLFRQGIGDIDFGLAERAGFNPLALDTKDPERYMNQLVQIYKRGSMQSRDALAQYLGPETFASIQKSAEGIGDSFKKIKVLDKNDQRAVSEFSAGVAHLAGWVKVLYQRFAITLLPTLKNVIKFITPIIETIVNWIDKNQTLVTVIAAVSFGMVALITTLAAVKVAILATTFAFKGLSIAMLTNPIGLILVGLGLLIVGAIALYKNWDKVTGAFNKFGNWFKNNWQYILTAVVPFIGLPLLIIKHWDTVKSWFGSFFGFLKNNAGKIALAFPLIGLPLLIIKHWDTVKSWFGSFFGFIKDNASKVALAFPLIGVPLLIIQNWDKVKDWFGNFFGFIKDNSVGLIPFADKAKMVIQNWDAVKSWFSNFFGYIKDKGTDLAVAFPLIGLPLLLIQNWGKFKQSFGDGMDFAKEKATGFFNFVKSNAGNFFGDSFNTAKDQATGFFSFVKSNFTRSFGEGLDNAKKNVNTFYNFVKEKSDKAFNFSNAKTNIGKFYDFVKNKADSGFGFNALGDEANYIVENWNRAKDWFGNFFNFMKDGTMKITNPIMDFIRMPEMIMDYWSKLQQFFNDLFSSIENAYNNTIGSSIDRIIGAVDTVGNFVGAGGQPSGRVAAASNAGNRVNQNVQIKTTIYASEGDSAEKIANKVDRKMQERLRTTTQARPS